MGILVTAKIREEIQARRARIVPISCVTAEPRRGLDLNCRGLTCANIVPIATWKCIHHIFSLFLSIVPIGKFSFD